MSWLYLIIAGITEALGVGFLNEWKARRSYTALAMDFLCFAVSLTLLSLAMNDLPMSIAYALWTGMGTIGGVLIGIVKYGESPDPKRLFCIALILIAAVGLKWSA